MPAKTTRWPARRWRATRAPVTGRQLAPTRVAVPPPPVPGFMVEGSEAVLPAPISRRESLRRARGPGAASRWRRKGEPARFVRLPCAPRRPGRSRAGPRSGARPRDRRRPAGRRRSPRPLRPPAPPSPQGRSRSFLLSPPPLGAARAGCPRRRNVDSPPSPQTAPPRGDSSSTGRRGARTGRHEYRRNSIFGARSPSPIRRCPEVVGAESSRLREPRPSAREFRPHPTAIPETPGGETRDIRSSGSRSRPRLAPHRAARPFGSSARRFSSGPARSIDRREATRAR